MSDSHDEVRRKAIRLEWITIGFLAVTVTLVYLVLGNSQAMKAAWLEDLLSFIPPFAFLIAARISRRAATVEHPYGYHRAVGIGHLVSGIALTSMAVFLIVDSSSGLLAQEHPTIGSVELFGRQIWLGWLMIGVMIFIAWPPVIIGHHKMKLAAKLHDKVLYADADMNKADWQTAVGSAVGVAGIGIGLWWLDSVAALFISASILYDGVRNLRIAVLDLMDEQARTYDGERPHPLAGQLNTFVEARDWVAQVGCRVRDQGHELQAEVFIVPRDSAALELAELHRLTEDCRGLDWKLRDVVLVPVAEIPPFAYRELKPVDSSPEPQEHA
ncbi:MULTISPECIES: cation diffusion facilitator family transporter [unclassified Pseudoclavibacter]|uniref:cation diffusion facilitator family transporter n=1 Tax=unclassified Pseudoclavibacter TaxID=2615177 RepID=UPI001BA59F40|nr:cation transporter [Pseudoclavibacter sp. Marseille-Q4354]MBS3177282.1 cation transporter [Pseudoclavibacter sp. Marseille-Q4354]